MYKCKNCESSFEKSAQYEAHFCPNCGDSLEKSVEETDLFCTRCESVFEKSVGDDFELSFCPKCGKSLQTFSSAMAEAPRATGDKPVKRGEDGPKSHDSMEGEEKAAMAEAPEAKGDAPSYTAPTAKNTGTTVKEQGEGANAIDGNDKEGYAAADGEDTDEQEAAPAKKKLEGAVDAAKAKFKSPVSEKVGVYGDTVKSVSVESRLEAIEKSLSESVGRQTVVPGAFDQKVEKSQPSQDDLDRKFVKTLFGR